MSFKLAQAPVHERTSRSCARKAELGTLLDEGRPELSLSTQQPFGCRRHAIPRTPHRPSARLQAPPECYTLARHHPVLPRITRSRRCARWCAPPRHAATPKRLQHRQCERCRRCLADTGIVGEHQQQRQLQRERARVGAAVRARHHDHAFCRPPGASCVIESFDRDHAPAAGPARLRPCASSAFLPSSMRSARRATLQRLQVLRRGRRLLLPLRPERTLGVVGRTTSSSVAAEPLWKYGACCQTPFSGVVRYCLVAEREA